MLELAAAEMAQAAALFVALEKEVEVLKAKGAESSVIQLKDTARYAGAQRMRQHHASTLCCVAASAQHQHPMHAPFWSSRVGLLECGPVHGGVFPQHALRAL